MRPKLIFIMLIDWNQGKHCKQIEVYSQLKAKLKKMTLNGHLIKVVEPWALIHQHLTWMVLI